MSNERLRYAFEWSRHYLRWPATAAALLAMALFTNEVQENRDSKKSPTQTTSTAAAIVTTTTSIIAIAPPITTERVEPSTTTTLSEAMGSRVLLATGLLIDGISMRFEQNRSGVLNCDDSQGARFGQMRLPQDLGPNAVTFNPLVPVKRLVFIGQQSRQPDVDYNYMSEGIAFGAENGHYLVVDFDVERQVGGLSAKASGVVVRRVSQQELRGDEGVSYNNGEIKFTARLNPAASPASSLELTYSCA